MLETDNGTAEIKRNELASLLGCVPSQINYVITSRFSPEHGYIVESRRGGGGYIKITRVSSSKENELMRIIGSIKESISYSACVLLLKSLIERNLITTHEGDLIHAAVSDRSLSSVSQGYRDLVRANTMKNMLIVILNK